MLWPGDSVFAPVLPLLSGPAWRRQGLRWNDRTWATFHRSQVRYRKLGIFP